MTNAEAHTAKRVVQMFHSIVYHYAKQFNVDEFTALEMIRENIDSNNVTQLIDYAAEIFSNEKVMQSLEAVAKR